MVRVLSYWVAVARTWDERRRAVAALERLSDAQLADLGLVRGTLESSVREGFPSPAPEAARLRPLRTSLEGCG